MASPVADKLFFAGEAMNTNGHTIAVHGASESAYIALEKTLNIKGLYGHCYGWCDN